MGDWIVKTPSTKHKDVPVNEYTAMKLAELVGVEIAEIKLVELNKLDNLPQINLPDEKLAFAIKRFDRDDDVRIHMEDFAQVLVKYAHEKYNSANYEQIGRIIYGYSGDGLADAQQFASIRYRYHERIYRWRKELRAQFRKDERLVRRLNGKFSVMG